MAHVQFTDVQSRPQEFLDLTSLTLNEFQQLVSPFEAAFRLCWYHAGDLPSARYPLSPGAHTRGHDTSLPLPRLPSVSL